MNRYRSIANSLAVMLTRGLAQLIRAGMRMVRPRRVLAIVFAVGVHGHLHAQSPAASLVPRLDTGTVVRITTMDGLRVEGKVRETNAARVTLLLDGVPSSVELVAIDSLWADGHRLRRGAGIGAAVIGMTFLSGFIAFCSSDSDCGGGLGAAVFMGGLGALPGALLGLAVGAANPKWTLKYAAPGVGSRVRLTAPTHGLEGAVGTVKSMTADAVSVAFVDGSVRTLDRTTITQLDFSTRRWRRALRGLGVAALVGGGAGIVLGLTDDSVDSGVYVASVGAFMASLAALPGLMIGAGVQSDQWAAAEPSNLGLSIHPILEQGRPGVRVGLSIPAR